MFIPIQDVIVPIPRSQVTIQETSLPSPPSIPPVQAWRKRKTEEKAGSPEALLQADKSYQQVRHMAYLSVIQEAYRNFTVEG